MEFKERLKIHRERLGVSQAELARRLGIHRSVCSRLEGDERSPNLSTIERICSALGISVAEFFAEITLTTVDCDCHKANCTVEQ